MRCTGDKDATDFCAAAGYTDTIPTGEVKVIRVYMDLAMGLNFAVDFLLLAGTNRLAGYPLQPVRTAGAAALGALYSGACLIPQLYFLGNALWRVVSLAGMAILAFGFQRSAVRRCGVFILLSMALGGIALCLGRVGFPALCLCAVGIWLLCGVAFGESVGAREYVPVKIHNGESCVQLTALRDSGNTLRDPVTGESVLVIDAGAAQKLTGLTQDQLRTPLETLAQRPVPGLRLIPYRAVGCGGSMLLGMRFARVSIGSKQRSAVVAFAPEGLGGSEGYQALAGGGL